MREIKFRVWDKALKRWAIYSLADNKLEFYVKGAESWKIDQRSRRFVLNQYIGLKDKNGKEIYEGDIVKAISFARWIGVVKYSDENQAFIFDDLDKKYRGKSTVFMNQFDDGFEILGNIYENPELLKEIANDN